jgi:hypothetical protein
MNYFASHEFAAARDNSARKTTSTGGPSRSKHDETKVGRVARLVPSVERTLPDKPPKLFWKAKDPQKSN